ncbi:unnamed protein product [Ambrosiozyma monospora]|uniref:Unnamed protein product n=1 Tax=Ambrosiozyma monospora TaxID=43982 RepID=A0A9W7DLG3_AMBMO|nr:unnamed protein product [Ambrosiozyma monospora]
MDFKIGSHHKARVLGYSQVDNLFSLTMNKKQIEEKFLTVDDIPIGGAVTAEVLRIVSDKGLQVKISDNFEAFVPSVHMSDIKLVYPERKFKIGGKVKGRVLRVTHHSGKVNVLVTLKKSLVNIEDEDVVGKFEDLEVGKRTPATVEKFHPGGCVVSFFGSVKAYLPNAEISETFVKRPEDHFKLNQTVKVRVLSIDPENKRVKVSCRVSDALSDTQKKAMSTLVPGKSVVSIQVVERQKDNVVVELDGSNLRGYINAGQLIDGNYEQNRAALKKQQVGATLEALVLEKNARTRIVKLTTKPSLLKAAKEGSFPTQFQDVVVSNKELHGYVKSVTSNGLFVSFGNGLTGLVLPRYASEEPIEDLTTAFFVNQSVSCYVVRIDEEKKRFLLSLKKIASNSKIEPTVNPVDPQIKTLDQFVPGVVTKAIVKSVRGTQLNMQLADNQQGRIDISQVFDSIDEIKDPKKPLAVFKNGDVLDVKIIGYHDARNYKFLPITHRKSAQIVLELSVRKSVLKDSKTFVSTSISDLSKGDEVISYINNFARGYLWVTISPSLKGKVSLMNLTNDASVFSNLEKEFPLGCVLKTKVESVDQEHNVLNLTAKDKPITSYKDISVGDIVPARVIKTRESYVLLELGEGVTASSFITDALNDYSDKLDDIFSTNDICAAKIQEIDIPNNKIHVSLRTTDAKDRYISSVDDLKKGDVVRGFIKNVGKNGLYVALSSEIHALVRVSDLSDSYLKEWKQFYRVHQPVIGKILKAEEKGKVLMTLKDSEVSGEANILKRFDEIVVGEIYEGSVRRITDFGVFVKLDGCNNIVGLCHHSEISDNKTTSDIQSIFGEGDRVKVKILALDEAKKQLSLGMKASYFSSEAKSADKEDEDGDVEMNDADSEANDSDSEDEMVSDAYANASESEDEKSNASDDEDNEEEGLSGGLSTGFDWTASILEQAKEEESSDDDELPLEGEKKKKKKRSTKVVEDKTADINTRAPQSVSDFERLLVGNPDSSILWMNYMSFQLQLSEVEKAREIAERALKTINYREEQEKLNIWIAQLNLENMFGTDDSLQEVFKKSCQYMEPFTMHQKLVAIYIASEKFTEADDLYKVMCKKFGSKHISVWVALSKFYLREITLKL